MGSCKKAAQQQTAKSSSFMKLALCLPLLCQMVVMGREIPEKEHTEMLLEVLRDINKYDKLMRPTYQVQVAISMFVDTMSSISTESMDYDVTIFFRQHWNDPRLAWGTTAFDNGTGEGNLTRDDGIDLVDSFLIDLLWIPDVFFVDEKFAQRHSIMRKNVLLDIGPTGDITYSDRLSLKLGCDMQFELFPFDSQLCELKMEPYALRKTQLDLYWKTKGTPEERAEYKGSIQMSGAIQLPSYEISRCFLKENCTMGYITGDFACLSAFFELTRSKKYYILNIYLPSILCVVIASTSFWVQLDIAPARVALGITSFLTMVALMQFMNEGMPRVSYTKALDVWMSVCLFFIFAAMCEYCVAHVFLRHEEEEMEEAAASRYQLHADSNSSRDKNVGQASSPPPGQSPSSARWSAAMRKRETQLTNILDRMENQEKIKSQSSDVDKWSRRIFPASFALFTIVYSIVYSVAEPFYQDQIGDLLEIAC